MKMIPIESSNINAIGFKSIILKKKEMITSGTLRIEFTHGASYDYKAVPSLLWMQFLSSESKGKFFHANIKDKFLAKKVGK